MNIVEKYSTKQFSALLHDGGAVLCDKELGAFLVLRSVDDLKNLKELLDSISIQQALATNPKG